MRGPMVPLAYRVARRRLETLDTWTLELEPAGDETLPPFAPGQFAMLYAFGTGEIPVSVSGDLTAPETLDRCLDRVDAVFLVWVAPLAAAAPAIDRIKSVSLEKQTFTPPPDMPDDVFANSLGVNTGPAERVEIAFETQIAPYVRARVWHSSQQVRDNDDGSLTLTMDVCHDWALRSWILS